MPTIATLAEIRVPTGYHSAGVDGSLTGIVAKDLGPGTMYLNGFATTGPPQTGFDMNRNGIENFYCIAMKSKSFTVKSQKKDLL